MSLKYKEVESKNAPKPGGFVGLPISMFVGKHIKMAFKAFDDNGNRTIEHMWIKVLRTVPGSKRSMVGILSNQPKLSTGFNLWDEITFDIEEIEELYTDAKC